MNDLSNHDVPPLGSANSAGSPRPLSLSDRVRSLRLPQRPAAPASRSAWLPWTLCLLLAGSTVALAVFRPEAKPATTENDKLGQDPSGASSGKPLAPGQVVLESKGYIFATHPYKVGPNQVGSKIKKLHERFLEGQWISKGEVLSELDDTEYRKKYEQAQGDYDSAVNEVRAAGQRLEIATRNRPEEIQQVRAELDEARATLMKWELDLERNEDLKTGRAVARRDYEDVKFSCDAQRRRVDMLTQKYNLVKETRPELREEARANLKKAQANLARAESARAETKWRLDNCIIRAPIDGTILKKYVELDDPCDARAFNLAAILCDMADLRDLEVELTIQEREIARVEEGQECLVRPETYPDKTFKGIVSRKMPTADRSKGAIPVRVKVLDIPNNNRDKYLVPDGGAIVTFLATEAKQREANLRRLQQPAAQVPHKLVK